MSTKHTPGPWLYRAKSCGVFTAPLADSKYSFGRHIFSFRDEDDPIDADLNLILAAPQLESWLRWALTVLPSDEAKKTFQYEKACDLLFLATGERL